MRLKGKVAIVTGGGRDIGRSVSIKLAGEGAKVVVNYKNGEEEAIKTVQAIKANGGEAIIVKADVTNAADVTKLVEETRKAFGEEIHILVNVAGGLVARKTLQEMDENFFDTVMNLNLKSVFLASKAVTPFMQSG